MATVLLVTGAGLDHSNRCNEPCGTQHKTTFEVYTPSLQTYPGPVSDVNLFNASDSVIACSTVDLRSSEANISTVDIMLPTVLGALPLAEDQFILASSANHVSVVESATEQPSSTRTNDLQALSGPNLSIDTAPASQTAATEAVENVETAQGPVIASDRAYPCATSKPPISMLSIFDLTHVGLSATSAISIFIVVGYVTRHMAGAGVTLSIIIAGACSFLAGNSCLSMCVPMMKVRFYVCDNSNVCF